MYRIDYLFWKLALRAFVDSAFECIYNVDTSEGYHASNYQKMGQ